MAPMTSSGEELGSSQPDGRWRGGCSSRGERVVVWFGGWMQSWFGGRGVAEELRSIICAMGRGVYPVWQVALRGWGEW
eukprot:CAMPEP_0174930758 /NCGR_PEP_ID=MMETSP1355-20121228/31335_1 /TAXON_ID=464990 /ORGANISM="Hemiselmis tepida, Strain CCMP443" /LENGTH=77 /DNA_ID=CAMNT_0016177075 /DNA_START=103 /DNA_END=336 /DNA_ORIENTATION=-